MSTRIIDASDAGVLALGFFAGLAAIGTFVVTVAARCFVIAKLWGWYVVPFLSVPTMGMATAFGLSLLVSYMTVRLKLNEKSDGFWKSSFAAIIYALLTLAVGWIGTVFLP